MVISTISLSNITPEGGLVTVSVTVKVSSPSNRSSLVIEILAQCSPEESAGIVMSDTTLKSDPDVAVTVRKHSRSHQQLNITFLQTILTITRSH